jgi:UDP-N-acetylmuramate dehydrogenase
MDWVQEFKERIQDFKGEIAFDAPLSKIAYYRIGGPARVLVTPRDFQDLELLHQILSATPIPFFVTGWGSNLLFQDEGFDGVIIRMKHLFTGVEEVAPGVLRVGASLGANALLKVASEKGYGGLSRFTGIPGSIGGMIAMNAGTHLGEMSEVIIESSWIELGQSTGPLQIQTRVHAQGDFSYRRNHFLKACDLILHALIRYESADPAQVKAEIESLYQRRKSTQPVEYPSCGSVFMNPKAHGLHAWQVIDQLGLRGHRIGNAQISEKHPNFIVNLGGATAHDVRSLIALVKSEAMARLSIELHEEVKVFP